MLLFSPLVFFTIFKSKHSVENYASLREEQFTLIKVISVEKFEWSRPVRTHFSPSVKFCI